MGGAASGFFPRGDAFALRISDAAVAPSPASVAAVGDTTGLTGTAGATLTNPLVVEVRDASKNALAGVTVNFTATNATVNPASAVTDAAGRASTRVTLGNTAGSATVTATVAGIAPVTFTIQVTQQGAGGGDNRPIVRSTLPVIQSFNGGTTMSSGTWIEVYGSNFAATTQEWAGSDFNGNTAPTQLAGVSVKVGGIAAYIRYVSPTQVNLQVPDFPATGPVQLQVTNANGTSDPMTVQKAKVSPGLLTTPAFNVNGKQYLAALHSDFVTFVGPVNLIPGVPFRPAAKDETIILLAVGCGPTTPATPAGQFFPDARPLASQVEVKFGATTASAQAFLAANTIGLCQLNVVTPNVASGDMTIDITVDGVGTGQTLYTTIE